MIVKPGSATLLLGDETHTSEDNVTSIARRLVVLKALNETKYRYTSIPGVLRAFAIIKGKSTENPVQTQGNKKQPPAQQLITLKMPPEKVQPLLKPAVQPLLNLQVPQSAPVKIQPLLTQTVQPLLKEHKQEKVQDCYKNTQSKPKVHQGHNEDVAIKPLSWERMLKDGSAEAVVSYCMRRNTAVSRNGQYRRFSNNYSETCCYERLVSNLASQNKV